MRTTLLPRRAVLGAVLATSLVGGGLAMAFAADATAGCSYTDPAGDSTISGVPGSGDDDLDITASGLSAAGGTVVGAVKVVALTDYGPQNYPGDDFEVAFTMNKKALTIGAYRDSDPTGGPAVVTPYAFVDGTDSSASAPSLKPTYDLKASTFSIAISYADLAKLSGAPADGATLTALKTTAYASFSGPERSADSAAPKDAATTYAVGASSCSGGAGPAPSASSPASTSASPSSTATASPSASASSSSSASPSASGSPTSSASPSASGSPAGSGDVPDAGCFAFPDPKGDSTAAIGPASTGNDPDLDLLGVTFRTTVDSLSAYLKVDKLAAKPSGPEFSGHRFDVGFTHNGKAILLQATGTGTGTGSVGGTVNADLKPKAVFDTAHSQVVLTIDRASVEKVAGAPLPNGTVVTKTVAHSTALIATGGATVADTAQGTTPEQQSYTVGDDHCFPASSSGSSSDTSTATIAISAPSRVHTSDPEVLTATLTDGNGSPLAGKRVTAVVGAGAAVAGTTNAAGQVKLSPKVTDRAGTRILAVRYSEAAGKAESRKPLTVLAEVSKIATKRAGTGSTRSFTVTLTDDDATRHPYAGARVPVSYSGRSVSVTTDRNGRATLRLRAGAHVDLRYAGKPGYVAAASARTVV